MLVTAFHENRLTDLSIFIIICNYLYTVIKDKNNGNVVLKLGTFRKI